MILRKHYSITTFFSETPLSVTIWIKKTPVEFILKEVSWVVDNNFPLPSYKFIFTISKSLLIVISPVEGFGKTLILNSVLSNIYSAIVWHPLVSVTMTKYVPEFGF